MKRTTNGAYTITRETYKRIKKYDHAQMDEFCTRVYQEGVRDGAKAAPGVDPEEVKRMVQTQLRESRTEILARISVIKGIGAAKMERIDEVLEEMFGDTEEKEEATP